MSRNEQTLDPAAAQKAELERILFYRNQNPLIDEAIDWLVARIHAYKYEFEKKSILLTGCGSANGTSMIAINLAIALSMAGWKTLLVDADLRKGSQYKRLSGQNEVGFSNYLRGKSGMNDITYKTNYPQLNYIPSGTAEPNATLLLCSEQTGIFLHNVRNAYEFVIVDCPSITVVPDASVLFHHVDGIALVAALGVVTKKQLTHARHEAEKNPDKYCGLIINRVEKQEYRHFFPQQGYFSEKNLSKKHRLWSRREGKPFYRERTPNRKPEGEDK